MNKVNFLLGSNKSQTLALAVIILYLTINLILQLFLSLDISTAPDATGQNLFIYQIAKNGFLQVDNNVELNLKYKQVFAPRGTVVNDKGEIVPLKAPFSSFVYGIPYTFLIQSIDVTRYLIIFNMLTIFAFILYCYKFVLSLGYKHKGINTIIITLLIVIGNLASIITLFNLLFFVGFYYLKIWIDSNKKNFDINVLLSSLMFSGVTLLRNELVILFIPIGIFFLFLIFVKKFQINILLFFLIPIISTLTILESNKLFYGGYFNFGYSLDSKSREAFTSGTSGGGLTDSISKIGKLFLLYGFHPLVTLQNVYYYVINLFYFLLVPVMLDSRDFKKNFAFSIFTVSMICYILIFYGSNGTFFGNGTPTFDSSYVRYFSPIYLLLLVYAVPFYIKTAKVLLESKLYKLSMVIIFVLLIINTYSTSYSNYDSLSGYQNLLDTIKQQIPPNSVIFTNYWDKLLYKDYQVATFSKQLNTMDDYYNTMTKFLIENPREKVYYIPSSPSEKIQFDQYLKNNKKVKCNNLNLLQACELTLT